MSTTRLAVHRPTSIKRVAGVLFWTTFPVLLLLALSRFGVWSAVGFLVLLPVAWLAADLTTGVVHWALDTYGSPQTPVLGPTIANFREHHANPHNILRGDFWDNTGESATPALPALALAGLLIRWSPMFAALALAYLGGAVWTNHIHRLTHEPDPPAWAVWLQQQNLILSPEEHARHHSGDHNRAYCITVGWMNETLDTIGFFPRLEARLHALQHRKGPTIPESRPPTRKHSR